MKYSTLPFRSAELPTGYVDSIPERKEVATRSAEEILSEQFEEEHFTFTEQSKTGFSSTDKNQPLLGWLQTNVDTARLRLSSHEPIRLETERLQVRVSFVSLIVFLLYFTLKGIHQLRVWYRGHHLGLWLGDGSSEGSCGGIPGPCCSVSRGG